MYIGGYGFIAYEHKGSKTNTIPSKTNTYEHLPIVSTLLPWTVPCGVPGPMEWQF